MGFHRNIAYFVDLHIKLVGVESYVRLPEGMQNGAMFGGPFDKCTWQDKRSRWWCFFPFEYDTHYFPPVIDVDFPRQEII